jgi:hypothetical protein
MNSRSFLYVLALSLVFGTGCASNRPYMLRYEPEKVQLVGTLTLQTFPGRPNYRDIHAGDEPETCWILMLDHPIRMLENGQDILGIPEERVTNVQLLVPELLYSTCHRLVNRKVLTKGTLFHAHTGHQHALVLMDTKDVYELK